MLILSALIFVLVSSASAGGYAVAPHISGILLDDAVPSTTNFITELINSIVQGFNGLMTGFGNGVPSFFSNLFVDSTTGGLTVFASVGLVMIGVGLAIGIARWIIKKVGR